MLTLVRFVPTVNSFVQQTRSDVAEALPALVTAVRFLSRVDTLVFGVVGGGSEGFVTEVTLVGSLTAVDALVDRVRRVMIETPSTQLTGVEFLFCVDTLVSHQIGLCEEGFTTESTLERLVTSVNVHVLLARKPISEALPAVFTAVWFLSRLSALAQF